MLTIATYLGRLRTLFWIAVTNFVFPVILNIAQIILLFLEPAEFYVVYVFYASLYLNIIGVLLATVWSSSTHWSNSEHTIEEEKRRPYTNGTLMFAPPASSASTAAKIRSVLDGGLREVGTGNEQLKSHGLDSGHAVFDMVRQIPEAYVLK